MISRLYKGKLVVENETHTLDKRDKIVLFLAIMKVCKYVKRLRNLEISFKHRKIGLYEGYFF